MVQLEPCRNFPALALVVKSMGRNQPVVLPEPRVPILLNDGKKPTSSYRVNHNIRFIPVAPLRNFGMVPNAPGILRLCAKFHVVGAAARFLATEVVQCHVFGNRPVSLLPIIPVAHEEIPVTMQSGVPILAMHGQYPTAVPVDSVAGCGAPTVAGKVHLRLAGDVPKFGLQSNRRLQTAAAETFPRSSNSFGRNLVVPAQEAVVASRHSSVVVIESDQRFGPTPASAKPGRVRASRVIGSQYLAPAACGAVAQSRIVPFDETGLRRQLSTTTAFAKVAGSIWCGLWWSVFELCGKQRGVVPVDEPSSARKSAVGTICDFSTPALARLAKIDLGHLISLQDLWSWLAGVYALCQPFHCNRCRVEVA
jgi:hypothetical protein